MDGGDGIHLSNRFQHRRLLRDRPTGAVEADASRAHFRSYRPDFEYSGGHCAHSHEYFPGVVSHCSRRCFTALWLAGRLACRETFEFELSMPVVRKHEIDNLEQWSGEELDAFIDSLPAGQETISRMLD